MSKSKRIQALARLLKKDHNLEISRASFSQTWRACPTRFNIRPKSKNSTVREYAAIALGDTKNIKAINPLTELPPLEGLS